VWETHPPVRLEIPFARCHSFQRRAMRINWQILPRMSDNVLITLKALVILEFSFFGKDWEWTSGSERCHKFQEESGLQGKRTTCIAYRIREEDTERKARKRRKGEEKRRGVEVGIGTRGDSSGQEWRLVTAGIENIRARPWTQFPTSCNQQSWGFAERKFLFLV